MCKLLLSFKAHYKSRGEIITSIPQNTTSAGDKTLQFLSADKIDYKIEFIALDVR